MRALGLEFIAWVVGFLEMKFNFDDLMQDSICAKCEYMAKLLVSSIWHVILSVIFWAIEMKKATLPDLDTFHSWVFDIRFLKIVHNINSWVTKPWLWRFTIVGTPVFEFWKILCPVQLLSSTLNASFSTLTGRLDTDETSPNSVWFALSTLLTN